MNKNEKIPRIIHYCWFGRGKKPKKINKCFKSWKRHLKGYEFIEWNEDNFDITICRYVKEAYEAKKYAFVSDYVRLYALYHYGGIYLDTDVEILKNIDCFLCLEAFSGFEDDRYVPTGLIASIKGHIWIKELLCNYNHRHFTLSDGTCDFTTNTKIITNNCLKYGLIPNGEYQTLQNGVTIFPRTFFCPYDYINGGSYISENSYAIHHFAKSWLPVHVRWKGELKRLIGLYISPKIISMMRRIVSNK